MKFDRFEITVVSLFAVVSLVSLSMTVNAGPQRLYVSLFRNSDVCSFSGAWAGSGETYRTQRAFVRMSKEAKLRSTSSGLQEWQTPFGTLFFPGKASAKSIHFALAQFDIGAYPGLTIRPGSVVLDCGTFVGDWAKWAIRAGAAKVIAFEPAAEQVRCVRLNLAEELRTGRVVLFTKGVWDTETTLSLNHVDEDPAANSVTEAKTANAESIELTTIDKVVAELKLDRLDAIKMDIEGAEVRALRGARETINRFRPQLAVATEHTADVLQNNRDVIRTMRELAPSYKSRCGYCTLESVLVPETLYFMP